RDVNYPAECISTGGARLRPGGHEINVEKRKSGSADDRRRRTGEVIHQRRRNMKTHTQDERILLRDVCDRPSIVRVQLRLGAHNLRIWGQAVYKYRDRGAERRLMGGGVWGAVRVEGDGKESRRKF